MKRPYCRIDGVAVQLYIVNGVMRFYNDGRPMPDLNKWLMECFEGKRKLQDVWEYHTNSGSSYEMVWGLFSKHGINNHTVTQCPGEPFKKFILYR